MEDLKRVAEPELDKRVNELRSKFIKDIDEFVDSTKIDKLDDLLKTAGAYEVKAILATDRAEADQWAEAASEKLRQIRLLLIAERIVASREMAAMIEAAAVSIWEGFKSVAGSMMNIAIKSAVTGLLGPAGGVIADAATGFLGEIIGGTGNSGS